MIAAKCVNPASIRTTLVSGLISLQPNSGGGIRVGTGFLYTFGPFPKIPKPHVNTLPSSEKEKVPWLLCINPCKNDAKHIKRSFSAHRASLHYKYSAKKIKRIIVCNVLYKLFKREKRSNELKLFSFLTWCPLFSFKILVHLLLIGFHCTEWYMVVIWFFDR